MEEDTTSSRGEDVVEGDVDGEQEENRSGFFTKKGFFGKDEERIGTLGRFDDAVAEILSDSTVEAQRINED